MWLATIILSNMKTFWILFLSNIIQAHIETDIKEIHFYSDIF